MCPSFVHWLWLCPRIHVMPGLGQNHAMAFKASALKGRKTSTPLCVIWGCSFACSLCVPRLPWSLFQKLFEYVCVEEGEGRLMSPLVENH